tara:strand:+ start:695 stop:1123 length:429 start_codon:yes stop_codon:yes gene_type:complete
MMSVPGDVPRIFCKHAREKILCAECTPQGDMFDAPDPPTGPTATEYTRDDGTWDRFLAFRYSDEGGKYYRFILDRAYDALDQQKGRFSVRTWTAFYRDEHNVGITNDFTPWIADELVQQEPLLLDIIQRKKRSKPQGGSLVS